MFGFGHKGLVDVFSVMLLVFLTASVSYAHIDKYIKEKLNAATVMGLIALIFAGSNKLIDSLAPASSLCKKISLSVIGLVVFPLFTFVLTTIDLIMYSVVSSSTLFKYSRSKTWFSLTIIADVMSLLYLICSFGYFRKPVKKGLFA